MYNPRNELLNAKGAHMRRLTTAIRAFHEDEQGHATVGFLSLLGAVGAIVLGIGAAGDTDWVPIAGGVLLAVGVLGGSLARHRDIDYDIYSRIDALEKK